LYRQVFSLVSAQLRILSDSITVTQKVRIEWHDAGQGLKVSAIRFEVALEFS
jgi:hypothetical protein